MYEYDNIVSKILEIIKEDKNQPEFILKNDLIRLLDTVISDELQFAYDEGYAAGKDDAESDNW